MGAQGDDILVIFDKVHDAKDGSLSNGFKGYLFKHEEGKQCSSILEMPLFVASINTPLIRFPDMAGNILREYYNKNLNLNKPTDRYEEWLKQLGIRTIKKSMDFKHGFYTNYGIYQMSKDKFLHPPAE